MAIKIGGTAMIGKAGFHMTFQNGCTISVQQHEHSYSTKGETAEVAAWDADGNWIKLGETDDVIGHQSADQVVAIINFVQGY